MTVNSHERCPIESARSSSTTDAYRPEKTEQSDSKYAFVYDLEHTSLGELVMALVYSSKCSKVNLGEGVAGYHRTDVSQDMHINFKNCFIRQLDRMKPLLKKMVQGLLTSTMVREMQLYLC